MTHPIVEAGARAIYEDREGEWDDDKNEMKQWAADLAVDHSRLAILAALRAMRKPSKAVKSAAYRGAELDERAAYFMRGWRAGIDALIKEIEG